MANYYSAPAGDPSPGEPSTVRQGKPASIWITQIVLLLQAIGAAVGAIEWLPYGIAAAAPSILVVWFLAIVITIAQFRRPVVRWAFGLGAVAMWTYVIARSWLRIVPQLPPGEPSAEQFGAVVGSIAFSVLFLALGARILFGEPAKQYFGGS